MDETGVQFPSRAPRQHRSTAGFVFGKDEIRVQLPVLALPPSFNGRTPSLYLGNIGSNPVGGSIFKGGL